MNRLKCASYSGESAFVIERVAPECLSISVREGRSREWSIVMRSLTCCRTSKNLKNVCERMFVRVCSCFDLNRPRTTWGCPLARAIRINLGTRLNTLHSYFTFTWLGWYSLELQRQWLRLRQCSCAGARRSTGLAFGARHQCVGAANCDASQ